MPALLELTIGANSSPWETLGLVNSQRRIADVRVAFSQTAVGVLSWTLSSADDGHVSIDGIDTTLRSITPDEEFSERERHEKEWSTDFCGARAIAVDHVVVNTDNLDRTSSAIESALGAERRRVRDAGRGVSQGFHVLANTVIEVVSGPHITEPGASIWGFVVVVDDIDAVCKHIGDGATPKKAAVQPGRFIASFRHETGLGVPVAVMSPR